MESKSKWGLFANIIFPMLTPTIVIVLLLRLAEAIKLFDIPLLSREGGLGLPHSPCHSWRSVPDYAISTSATLQQCRTVC